MSSSHRRQQQQQLSDRMQHSTPTKELIFCGVLPISAHIEQNNSSSSSQPNPTLLDWIGSAPSTNPSNRKFENKTLGKHFNERSFGESPEHCVEQGLLNIPTCHVLVVAEPSIKKLYRWLDLLSAFRARNRTCFVAVIIPDATEAPALRIACFARGVTNMMTSCAHSLANALHSVVLEGTGNARVWADELLVIRHGKQHTNTANNLSYVTSQRGEAGASYNVPRAASKTTRFGSVLAVCNDSASKSADGNGSIVTNDIPKSAGSGDGRIMNSQNGFSSSSMDQQRTRTNTQEQRNQDNMYSDRDRIRRDRNTSCGGQRRRRSRSFDNINHNNARNDGSSSRENRTESRRDRSRDRNQRRYNDDDSRARNGSICANDIPETPRSGYGANGSIRGNDIPETLGSGNGGNDDIGRRNGSIGGDGCKNDIGGIALDFGAKNNKDSKDLSNAKAVVLSTATKHNQNRGHAHTHTHTHSHTRGRGHERDPKYVCPYCGLDNLTEDELWVHCPLYHINEANDTHIRCPICKYDCVSPFTRRGKPFQAHLRNRHGRCSQGLVEAEDAHRPDELYAFALVVCQRSDGRILLVHEFAGAGFWLPGGRVETGESLSDAARRETREEAGIDVVLTGVLRVQHTPRHRYTRLRVVFLARPADEEQLAKSLPDYESVGAAWVETEKVKDLPLRGRDPLVWIEYLRNGGQVYPLAVLGIE